MGGFWHHQIYSVPLDFARATAEKWSGSKVFLLLQKRGRGRPFDSLLRRSLRAGSAPHEPLLLRGRRRLLENLCIHLRVQFETRELGRA